MKVLSIDVESSYELQNGKVEAAKGDWMAIVDASRILSHRDYGYYVPPLPSIWSTILALASKQRFLEQAFASLPLLALLVCCHAAGGFIDYMAEPGKGPQRLTWLRKKH